MVGFSAPQVLHFILVFVRIIGLGSGFPAFLSPTTRRIIPTTMAIIPMIIKNCPGLVFPDSKKLPMTDAASLFLTLPYIQDMAPAMIRMIQNVTILHTSFRIDMSDCLGCHL